MLRIARVLATLRNNKKIMVVALAVSIGAAGALWATFSPKPMASTPIQVVAATPTPTPTLAYELRIEKLSLTAPIIPNVPGTNETEYLKAIENGVAHYAGTALPGNTGNTFIFGHSSYYKNKPGSYKEVFKDLNALSVGDKIEVLVSGEALVYEVKKSKIVTDDDMSILAQGTDETLTLMTCWPPGTLLKRYVVQAERVINQTSLGSLSGGSTQAVSAQ